MDDDPAVCESLRFLLELSGHRVATYGSAAGFLDDRTVQPGCMILDHYMPAMSGLELVARLQGAHVRMPILLITGSPSPAILSKAAELGITTVLQKPPEPKRLLDFVDFCAG